MTQQGWPQKGVAMFTKGHSGDINYMQTPFQEWLRARGACRQAREWVGVRTFREAWADCENTSWMGWLIEQVDRTQCCCAVCIAEKCGATEDTMTANAIRVRFSVSDLAEALFPGGEV